MPGHYTREMAITDTAVHEIDMVRWMFGEEIVAATGAQAAPQQPRRRAARTRCCCPGDRPAAPWSTSRLNVNIRYGYDIRGEVVGENGTVALGESSSVIVRRGNQFSGRVPEDWRERFIRAYDVEFQEWIDAVRDGGTFGPSSWDGYAAAAVSDARRRGAAQPVSGSPSSSVDEAGPVLRPLDDRSPRLLMT